MILQEIFNPFLRSIFAFVVLLTLTRIMGRKAISEMTFFDFAVGITIGSVTGNLALGSSKTPYAPTTIMITMAALTLITGYFHIKSLKFSKLVDSEPIVIVENGKINDKNMQRERINIQKLNSLLREKNIFNLADVEFAILEHDGKLSVLPKSQKQPLTPSDMNISTTYIGLTKDIIFDGKVLYENLKDVDLNEEWLKKQLNSQGIQKINDVFYAGLDTSGNLYVSRKTDASEKHGKYGIE